MYAPDLTRSEAYHWWSGSLDPTEVVVVHLIEVGTNGHRNVVKVRDSSCCENIIESRGIVLNQPCESGGQTSKTHGPIGRLVCELVVSRERRYVKILLVDAHTIHDIFYLGCA